MDRTEQVDSMHCDIEGIEGLIGMSTVGMNVYHRYIFMTFSLWKPEYTCLLQGAYVKKFAFQSWWNHTNYQAHAW